MLTGLAVSVCGPVGLIALLAPELARALCRRAGSLTAAALAGASFMLIADLLGRTLFAPLEIPVNIGCHRRTPCSGYCGDLRHGA